MKQHKTFRLEATQVEQLERIVESYKQDSEIPTRISKATVIELLIRKEYNRMFATK